MMKRKRISVLAKYLLAIDISLLIINICLGYVLMKQSSSALISLIQNRMLDMSNTAASMIDGDALEKLKAEDIATEKYQKVIRTLRHFQNNIDLKFIYCIKDMGNNKFILSVDPSIVETGEFGDPIVTTDALIQASLGKPAVSTESYEDKWGRFYSSYSPIFNSSGKVAGIVAVDLTADWYEKQFFNSVRTILISTFLSIIVGGLILILVTHISRKRFRYFYSQLSLLKNTIEELLFSIDNIKSLKSLENNKVNKIEDRNDVDNIDSLRD